MALHTRPTCCSLLLPGIRPLAKAHQLNLLTIWISWRKPRPPPRQDDNLGRSGKADWITVSGVLDTIKTESNNGGSAVVYPSCPQEVNGRWGAGHTRVTRVALRDEVTSTRQGLSRGQCLRDVGCQVYPCTSARATCSRDGNRDSGAGDARVRCRPSLTGRAADTSWWHSRTQLSCLTACAACRPLQAVPGEDCGRGRRQSWFIKDESTV